jgi:hypothetical protein
MPTPRLLKDALRSIVSEIVQRHAAAVIKEIAAAMTDEVEALVADRVADLRTQLECENDQAQLFPELEESPQAAECVVYDAEHDTWTGVQEAFAAIRKRVRNGGSGWNPQ